MKMLFLAMAMPLIVCFLFAIPSTAAVDDVGTGSDDIELDVEPALDQDVYQGRSVSFTIGVRNSNEGGDDKDYDLTAVDDAETGALTLALDPTSLDAVEKSMTEEVILTATATAAELGMHTLLFNVTDASNESTYKNLELTVNVQEAPDYEVSIEFDATPLSIVAGDSADVEITITNEADVDDTLVMEQSASPGGIVNVVFAPGNKQLPGGESFTVTATIAGMAPGTATVTLRVVSNGDVEKSDEGTVSITVTAVKTGGGGDDGGFLEADVAGIPLIALFLVIIVVPIVAVVFLQKKKAKKGAAAGAQAGMPGAMPGAPGMAPGMPGYGVPQPMVMHCPNCGGVIEIANPAMPQPVQCRHCGSRYNFPGTGQPAAQPGYGYAAPAAPQPMQQTPCPACRTPIPIPPQRPVTVACPGCGAQYNLN